LLSLAKKKELQKKSQLELSNKKHFFVSATQRINLDLLTQELFESIKKNQETVTFSSPLHKIYDFTVPIDWQIVSLKPHY
jgi:50S ribosomal subunit-associated GTPase HflX